MVMKIYAVWIIAIIILFILSLIFERLTKLIENNNRYKNISNTFNSIINIFVCIPSVLVILFFPYNIYTLVLNLDIIINLISLLYILIFLVCFIGHIQLKEESFFDLFIEPTLIAIYIFFSVALLISPSSLQTDIQKHSEYSYTIDILNMQQVPYTNVSGQRYYIKSVPSGSYYYEVKTKNGNTTTKIIDGYNHYVEKDINNKYINNPHIDVYQVIKTYYDLYGRKKSEIINEDYIICVPEDAIYYESESQ